MATKELKVPVKSELYDLPKLPEVMTARALSDYIGISEGSLANDRANGAGIPFVRIGRRIRYLRADVARYLAAHRTESIA